MATRCSTETTTMATASPRTRRALLLLCLCWAAPAASADAAAGRGGRRVRRRATGHLFSGDDLPATNGTLSSTSATAHSKSAKTTSAKTTTTTSRASARGSSGSSRASKGSKASPTAAPTIDFDAQPRVRLTVPASLCLSEFETVNESTLEVLRQTILKVAEGGLTGPEQRVADVHIEDVAYPVEGAARRRLRGAGARAGRAKPAAARGLAGGGPCVGAGKKQCAKDAACRWDAAAEECADAGCAALSDDKKRCAKAAECRWDADGDGCVEVRDRLLAACRADVASGRRDLGTGTAAAAVVPGGLSSPRPVGAVLAEVCAMATTSQTLTMPTRRISRRKRPPRGSVPVKRARSSAQRTNAADGTRKTAGASRWVWNLTSVSLSNSAKIPMTFP